MKAKDYTDYLIGATPKSTRGKLLTFLLGSQRAAAFYDARHLENGTRLMWIETNRWGDLRCYPCVLETPEEILVFETGDLPECKKNNLRLVERWEQTVNSQTIITDYTVTEVEKKPFYEIFHRYRQEDLDRAVAQAKAEMAAEKVLKGEPVPDDLKDYVPGGPLDPNRAPDAPAPEAEAEALPSAEAEAETETEAESAPQ